MKQVIIMAILLAAMFATGCSKSESENMEENNMTESNEKLLNTIKQHIVGTWVHDGSCESDAPLTPYSEIFLKDNLKFEESEHETFTFKADGSAIFQRSSPYPSSDEVFEFPGRWEVIGSYVNAENNPPFGIRINYDKVDGYNLLYQRFFRVIFSSNYRTMYLHSVERRSEIQRYVPKS